MKFSFLALSFLFLGFDSASSAALVWANNDLTETQKTEAGKSEQEVLSTNGKVFAWRGTYSDFSFPKSRIPNPIQPGDFTLTKVYPDGAGFTFVTKNGDLVNFHGPNSTGDSTAVEVPISKIHLQRTITSVGNPDSFFDGNLSHILSLSVQGSCRVKAQNTFHIYCFAKNGKEIFKFNFKSEKKPPIWVRDQ